eukprot:1145793-Amphidinium_carterae.1
MKEEIDSVKYAALLLKQWRDVHASVHSSRLVTPAHSDSDDFGEHSSTDHRGVTQLRFGSSGTSSPSLQK